MFNDGVSFNIQVRDSKTKNIIITEVVNKTSINNNIIINTLYLGGITINGFYNYIS